jgi:hypothetical protein
VATISKRDETLVIELSGTRCRAAYSTTIELA